MGSGPDCPAIDDPAQLSPHVRAEVFGTDGASRRALARTMDHDTRLGVDHNGRPISIDPAVRFTHTAIFGATGSGKSTLIENMIAQDLRHGDGVLVLDPHGPLAEKALALVPRRRTNEVCVFDSSDAAFPIAWNPLFEPDHSLHPKIADYLTLAIKAAWPDSWGPRLENLLRFGSATLLATPDASLANLQRLLSDDVYRQHCIGYVHNTTALNFWRHDYATWTPDEKREARAPVMNKVDQILFFPELLHILGQRSSKLDIDSVMAERRIVIANLAKGATSETAAFLIGSLLLGRFNLAGFARAAVPAPMPAFHVYIDEAKSFAPRILRPLLNDARKFHMSLTLATQGTADLDPQLRASILDNVGSLICFRLGPDDAAELAPQFAREHQAFNHAGLMHLHVGEAWARVQAPHGGGTHHLLTDPPPPPVGDPTAVRQQSRQAFTRPVAAVAGYIRTVTAHTTVEPSRLRRPRKRLP